MPVAVDTYDAWGNYQGTVHLKTVQEKDAENLGGCVGVILGFFLVFFVQGIVSMLPLFLRVFMEPEVAKVHARRSRKLFIAAAIILVGYYVLNFLFAGNGSGSGSITANDLQWMLNFGIGLIVLGIVAQGMILVHQLLANIYPDKVNGNGYGLLALSALIPSIQPNPTMTLISDWGPAVGLFGFILIAGLFTEGINGTFITTIIGAGIILGIIFGVPIWYLSSTDAEFADASLDYEEEDEEYEEEYEAGA